MKRLIKYFVVCLIVFAGCATQHAMVERAIVINNTEGIISEVVIRHEPTGKIGAANMILPRNSFDLGFSKQPLLAEEAIISWRNQDGHHQKVKVKLPDFVEVSGKEQPGSLVYTIYPGNIVSVELKE